MQGLVCWAIEQLDTGLFYTSTSAGWEWAEEPEWFSDCAEATGILRRIGPKEPSPLRLVRHEFSAEDLPS